MKAISLWQPWATLIAIGAKHYETRHWAASYRGPLVIHAAKTQNELGVFESAPFANVLAAAGYFTRDDLPFGAAVAFAWITGCHATQNIVRRVSDQERAFGDWSYGRYAWDLVRVVMLPEPIPMRGMQSLFNAPSVPELSEGAYRDLLRAKNAEINPEADSHDDPKLIIAGYAPDESGRTDTPPSERYYPDLEQTESADRGGMGTVADGSGGGSIDDGLPSFSDGAGTAEDRGVESVDSAAADLQPGTMDSGDTVGGTRAAENATITGVSNGFNDPDSDGRSQPGGTSAANVGVDRRGGGERDQRGDRDGSGGSEGMGIDGNPTPPDAAESDGLQLSLFG